MHERLVVEQSSAPFTERDAVFARVAMQAMLASPEIHDAAKTEGLVCFAHDLYIAPPDISEAYEDLESVSKISIESTAKTMYGAYFQTAEGRQALGRLGVEPADDTRVIRAALSTLIAEGGKVPPKVRREVATESRNWYKRQLSDALMDEKVPEEWQDSPVIYVNYDPSKLLNKLDALHSYRQHYRAVGRQLKETEQSHATRHKAELLQLHWARVNNMTASLYPAVLHLAEQIAASPDTPLTQEWRRRLTESAPLVGHLWDAMQTERHEVNDRFLRRLDLVRHGAELSSEGDFSSIAHADIALATRLETEGEPEQPTKSVEKLPAEVITELENETWDKNAMGQLLAGVLEKWDLLSAVPYADEQEVMDRDTWAEDGKWQLVFRTRSDELSIDGKKRVMYIPDSYGRSGSQTLAKSAHELMHVVQDIWDDHLAENIPLAKVHGRRHMTGREMGGLHEERRVFAMLGQGRATNTTYLRALEAKENGGNQLQVARAFFDELDLPSDASSAAALQSLAENAADRILRLYRAGGHNSQPLDYLEQELLLRSMSELDPDTIRARVAAAASFSFKDSAILHAMGLLELPSHIPQRPAEDVIEVYLAQRNRQAV